MERDVSQHSTLVAGTYQRSGPQGLEDDADRVLDVLTDEFDGVAVGPVVGCDLELSLIDVRFSVDGETASEVHKRISEITDRIDESIAGHVTTTTTPADQFEAACA
jgi:hypothetical protein